MREMGELDVEQESTKVYSPWEPKRARAGVV